LKKTNSEPEYNNLNISDEIQKGGVSRHETFSPRYGWLKKGYEALLKGGDVFNAEDAIERLGVGKNMVRSIRSWCLAFHLIEYNDLKRKGSGSLSPSELGNKLLDNNDGWDPFLEDIASFWLLHWQLFVPPIEMASWPIVFNHCNLPSFDLKQLGRSLITAAHQYKKLSSMSEGSFEKDASCIIRMYTSNEITSSSDIDCPFTQLGIIRPAEESNTFRFDISTKQSLPSLIFAAACFSYAYYTQEGQRTISLRKLVYEINSPGVVFKISETEAGRLLDDATRKMKKVDFVELMGTHQLQFEDSPENLFWMALNCYYYKESHRGFNK